jgi:CDP-paratose 2-epimerase
MTMQSARLRSVPHRSGPIVITGGAGFIGSNLAASLAVDGEQVIVLDNLSRPGVERNLAWLQRNHPAQIDVWPADVRNLSVLEEIVTGARAVFHFAAQVAVTTSLQTPLDDFTVNAQGTLQVLEAVRRCAPAAPVIFASTNKVYGGLQDIPLAIYDGRHMPVSERLREFGIDEERPLEFSTPYGCSKGAADQYVLDYAKSYGLRTALFRMSCIYGPRQFGTEDQGWLAHFLIRALDDKQITIYGDGRQVRDVLHVRDAVAAYRALLAALSGEGAAAVRGRAFNLGGGPANAVSLNNVLDEIAGLLGRNIVVARQTWRTGDQRYFVADTRRARDALGWRAVTGWREGLRDLAGWLLTERNNTTPALPLQAERLTA